MSKIILPDPDPSKDKTSSSGATAPIDLSKKGKKYLGTCSRDGGKSGIEVSISEKLVAEMGGIVTVAGNLKTDRRLFSLISHNEELAALARDLIYLELFNIYKEKNPSIKDQLEFSDKMPLNFDFKDLEIKIPKWLQDMVRDRLDCKNGNKFRVSMRPITIGRITINDKPDETAKLDQYLKKPWRADGMSCTQYFEIKRSMKRTKETATAVLDVNPVAKKTRERSRKRTKETAAAVPDVNRVAKKTRESAAPSSHNPVKRLSAGLTVQPAMAMIAQPSSSSSSSSSSSPNPGSSSYYGNHQPLFLPLWHAAVTLPRAESPENALYRTFDEYREAVTTEITLIDNYNGVGLQAPLLLESLLENIKAQTRIRVVKAQAFNDVLISTTGRTGNESFIQARTAIFNAALGLNNAVEALGQDITKRLSAQPTQTYRYV